MGNASGVVDGGGCTSGAAAEARKLAAGAPGELDWRLLLEQVFLPSHQARLVCTAEAEVASGQAVAQPRRVVLTLALCGCDSDDGPPAGGVDSGQSTSEVVRSVFLPLEFDGRLGVFSQKGKKRGPNQDGAFFLEFRDGDGSDIWMAAVCDGHGPTGHEISALVLDWLPLFVLREPTMGREPGLIVPRDPQAVFDGITAAFARTAAVARKASAEGSLDQQLSGTTCAFALCSRGVLHTAHVGDSRVLLGALPLPCEGDGSSSRVDVRGLTRDHKPEDPGEVERIRAQGGVVRQQRVWLGRWPHVGLNMSRSFGDALVHDVGVSADPDVAATFLEPYSSGGSRQFVVLASDGVWEFMSNDEAGELVGDVLASVSQEPTCVGEVASRAGEVAAIGTGAVKSVTGEVKSCDAVSSASANAAARTGECLDDAGGSQGDGGGKLPATTDASGDIGIKDSAGDACVTDAAGASADSAESVRDSRCDGDHSSAAGCLEEISDVAPGRPLTASVDGTANSDRALENSGGSANIGPGACSEDGAGSESALSAVAASAGESASDDAINADGAEVSASHCPDVADGALGGMGAAVSVASAVGAAGSGAVAASVGPGGNARAGAGARDAAMRHFGPAQMAARHLALTAEDRWREQCNELDDITVVVVCARRGGGL
eukprot:TRINITY_DN25800_c0_g1_i1.p1 TRINITY_DN25800_c0_g1~~TRINITY_DN25800_c0_g1_i1.p1  ORF type:complete len:689 (+),score=137.50 TRINITY_DN25800_c0_g1_i1:80-2068(+)